MRKEIESLLEQADEKMLAEIHKMLTRTETFEYHDYTFGVWVSVDIIYNELPTWHIKGKRRRDKQEVEEVLIGLTIEEVCDSDIGQDFYLCHYDVLKGLGWHDAGTFWGSPPHVEQTVDKLVEWAKEE